MAEDLGDEINAAVHARLRARDIPKAIWEAAVKEVGEESPTPCLDALDNRSDAQFQ